MLYAILHSDITYVCGQLDPIGGLPIRHKTYLELGRIALHKKYYQQQSQLLSL